MQITNFGHFKLVSTSGIMLFENEHNQDWYTIRRSLTTEDAQGNFLTAIYGAWAVVDPSNAIITNVEHDPSRLVPNNRIVLGIDADPSDIVERSLFKDGKISAAPTPPPSDADIVRELDRRLAKGFDFNFGDDRGIHRIGTTEADMERWTKEVTPLATALLNLSQPDGKIAIRTDTGPVSVSAREWQTILLTAGTVRQPLYQAFFAIKSLSPYPADFAADFRWP